MAPAFFVVQRPCDSDQGLGKVCIDALVALLVCIGERTAHNLLTDPRVIELVPLDPQTGFDIPKALPIDQLYESHAEALAETPQPFYISLALVALHATPKRMHWKVVRHLEQNKLPRILGWPQKT